MGKSKLGKFIQKVGKVIPSALTALTQLGTGNILGAVGTVNEVLNKAKEESKEAQGLLNEFELRKEELTLEAFQLEAKDRENARLLYKSDSIIQKVFAIAFLVGYGFLSWYLIQIVTEKEAMPKLAETLIVMIWTGTSTKLGTVVDFLFGGSMKS